jgi:PAS domain S-box-containing protein
MPPGLASNLKQLGLAALATGLGLAARLPLWPVLDARFPYLTFFPAVALAGYLGGVGAGLVATALGALTAGFFLLEPRFTLFAPVDAGSLVIFLLGGVLMSVLSGSLHRARRHARDSAVTAGQLCAQLDALFSNSPVGFAFFDAQRRAVRVNPVLAQLRGQAPAALEGKSIDAVLPPTTASAGDLLERVLASRQPILDHELTGKSARGEERAWLLGLCPLPPGEPPGLVGLILLDITERRRLEQELRQRVADLAENDRRKDVFLAMLSHELRNPLASVRSGIDSLAQGQPVGPAVVGLLQRQLGILTRLVDDLLDTARMSHGLIDLRRQPADLAGLVEGAVEMMQGLIDQRRHRLFFQRPPQPVGIDADCVRLTQVFANLLHNACRYTPPAGRIIVEVTREGEEGVVRISDTGIGIRPEMLGRIFELFQQGDQPPDVSPQGLGLGLTLVRRLVELHGGCVLATSPGANKGSVFEVRLPALPASRDLPRRTTAPALAGSTIRRVLIVDDNEDAGEALSLVLQVHGHETRTARDGTAALAEAASFRPEVVFLDIGLPGLDGYEVARRLRERFGAAVRLVALTGFGQDEDRRRGREAGFDEFLVKPAGPEELMQALVPAPAS